MSDAPRVRFWGAQGSLPAPLNTDGVQRKLVRALESAVALGLDKAEDIPGFLAGLPWSVRATVGGNTSCTELTCHGRRLILDAGSGLRLLGNHILKQGGPPKSVHILLSHAHWDHIQGFPFFVPAYIPGVKIHVHGGHKDLEQAFRTQHSAPWFPVDFDELGADIEFHVLEPGEPAEIAGFHVACHPQRHPGGSFGYRIECGGKTVVYSTDSEHGDESGGDDYPFLKFLKDADLLIFDAQYLFGESVTDKANWGHSSNIVGVELAKRAGAKRLCLFHHEPSLTDEDLEKYHASTLQYAKLFMEERDLEVLLAEDGMEIEL